MMPVGFQPDSFYCSSKTGECRENEIINSAFLHGVEWGRLIVHRTLEESREKTKIIVKQSFFDEFR